MQYGNGMLYGNGKSYKMEMEKLEICVWEKKDILLVDKVEPLESWKKTYNGMDYLQSTWIFILG